MNSILLLKLFVLFLIYEVKSFSLRPNSYLTSEEAIDEFEVSDFQKLLKKFDIGSSTKSKNFLKNLEKTNSIPRMRFTEAEGSSQEDPNSSGNPDGLDINIKFNDENRNFLFDNSSKDKELQRREGLSNGLILYNNRRTLNTETPDHSNLYFDLISNE